MERRAPKVKHKPARTYARRRMFMQKSQAQI
jgi:hypothetical protein